MPTILVSGALANKTRNGGEAWVRLSWIRGFQKLGLEVYFVEQIAPATCIDQTGAPTNLADSINNAYFQHVTAQFGLTGRAALALSDGTQCTGMAWDRLVDVARSADLLVNISGHLRLEPLLGVIRRKAYIDIDPGFTQFWLADQAMSFDIGGHDFYYTIGENIGKQGCIIPTCGTPWRPVRQPVVLSDWPVTLQGNPNRFTTVASWRGAFGPVQVAGRNFGLKVHEFRKYRPLPTAAAALCGEMNLPTPEFEIALDIHPADKPDLDSLRLERWRTVNPREVAADPHSFRQYVQSSGAEFSVAQGIYVDTDSGWFSDRTIRYLASGKPALVQETGFSRNLISQAGLVPFSSPQEAANGAMSIVKDYPAHSAAARAIAEQYFDSDKVLSRFLDEVGTRQ